MTGSAESVVARVPEGRDRFADLLRVGSIGFVVLGHWLVVVVLTENGGFEAAQLLAIEPWTRPLTWLFQVMPVFFFVGGYVNLASWARAQARGEGWASWVRRRSRRLLGPLVPLLVLWLPTAILLDVFGLSEDLVARAVETAVLPVWFLVVYTMAVGLVPVTAVLHRRLGVGLLALTTVAIVVVDRLDLADVPAVGYANYALVWLSVHQLGYLWHDGRALLRPALLVAGGAAGALLTVALIRFGGYPVSMVAVWGEDRSNTDPPSITLWTFALAQIAVLLALRGPASRWLQRPRVYAPIVVLGAVVLTLFLWHMTAVVLATTLVHPTGLWPETSTIDATWWAWRPVWLALCAGILAGLVAVFRRFEEVHDPVPREGRAVTLAGLLATITGLAMLMIGGVYDPSRTAGVPLAALGLLAVGLGALGVLRHPVAVMGAGSDDEDDADAEHDDAGSEHDDAGDDREVSDPGRSGDRSSHGSDRAERRSSQDGDRTGQRSSRGVDGAPPER